MVDLSALSIDESMRVLNSRISTRLITQRLVARLSNPESVGLL